MKRIPIEDSKLNLQQLVQIAQEQPVVLTQNGAPVAGVLEVDDGEFEAWSLAQNPDFIAMIERFRERGRREGAIPLDELRRRWNTPKGASKSVGHKKRNS